MPQTPQTWASKLIKHDFDRSDDDDASGGKYTRMDQEDNIQDKERFARFVKIEQQFKSAFISKITSLFEQEGILMQ